MVPMTLQFIIVMIASPINDRLQRKLEQDPLQDPLLQPLDSRTGDARAWYRAKLRWQGGGMMAPRLAEDEQQHTMAALASSGRASGPGPC
jgi:hypothetical protein